MNTPSGSVSGSGSVKRQRQRHQYKSMVTLPLTLLMGPRSILERHHIPNVKSDAHLDAAAAT